jgi:tetratricopeptide (TPR) repeat protein
VFSTPFAIAHAGYDTKFTQRPASANVVGLLRGACRTDNGTMRHRVIYQVAVVAGALFWIPPSLRAADCGASQYDCAVFYIAHHNLTAAIRTLNEELRQSPQNLKALNLLGIALTESGQVEQANSRFKQALAIEPRFYPARKNLAINEFNLNQLAEAATQFARVLREAPEDEIVHIYLAEISLQKNDYAAALQSYQKGLGRVMQNPLWIVHYAQCLIAQGDTARAIAALKQLPAADADDRFQAGLILGRAGAYSDAAGFFASARKNYANPYLAGYNQLLMLTRAGNFPEAIQLFDQLLSEGYGKAELYNLVSEAYLKSGHLQEAYDSLRTATRLEPEAEENYVDLVAVCLENENYDLALDILKVGTHYVPNSYRLYVQRGVALVMRGHMEEAEKEFQTASTLAPDKSLPYVALGEVWMQSGHTDKAVALLRERSKLSQTDFLVPFIFALALIRSGADAGSAEAAEAIQALEASIRLNPKFSHSHAELGRLLLKQGAIDRAIPELKTASELDPTDSGPLYQLGQAYRKKGQKSEAEAMLARVAELHSQDHEMDLKKELKRMVKQDTSPSETQEKSQ